MPAISTDYTANHADSKALLTAMLADYTAIRGSLAGLLTGSKTYDTASLLTLTQATTTLTVTGAAIGDFVMVSGSIDLAGFTVTGYVSAADTVTFVLFNGTSGTVDLASMTLSCVVLPKASFKAPAALTVTA